MKTKYSMPFEPFDDPFSSDDSTLIKNLKDRFANKSVIKRFKEMRDLDISRTFRVLRGHENKINAWAKKQDLKVAKKQGLKSPYYGAIGGELTYSFSPTSLGVIFVVQHSNGAKLDLTEYDRW